MAHPGNGVCRRCAGHLDRVGIVDWIFTRHQKIRFSFPHHVHVGPGSRAIRCAAVYLRNAGFFGNCVNHCCAIGHRDGGIPYGTCSVVGSAAAHFADRDARRDPQRNSRTLGHLRDGAVAPELSFSIPETILWLDTTFHRPDLRPVHVCRRNYHSHHDFANHHVGLARDFAQRAGFAA